jgi:DNA-binding LacI/PurR family transcriptional regulator
MQMTEMDFAQPTQRRLGWENALTDSGLEVHNEWFVASDFTISGAYHAVKQILGNPQNSPTAVVCASDEMGFGAIMAAKDLGLRVPQDVSIIGVDNHDLSDFFGQTTISQDVRGQGRHVARTILKTLDEYEEGQPINVEQIETWPFELVVRSSTARPTSR